MIIYFLAVLLLAWIPSIKSHIRFSESFLVVFKGYFASGFFALVLFIGIIAIIFLFERLFFSLEGNWYSYTFIGTFQLFLPLFFLSFIPDYQNPQTDRLISLEQAIEMPNFLEKLISYILIPIMVVYTVLLVLYIISNISTGFFQENLLEALILTYAINGWTLLILADLIENQIANFFKKVFPYFLIFVIVFQIIATVIEIQEIGFTHGRYFILLFGIGTIISALWYLFKKPDLFLLPIVSLIAGVIALIPPFDAVGLSVRNQLTRIEHILEEHNMLVNNEGIRQNPNVPVETQDQLKSSIQYLKEINALNQLTWLPEDKYYDIDELFGFNDQSVIDEDIVEETQYYDIELIEGDFSLPVERYNYMFHLTLEKDDQAFEVGMIEDEMINLYFDLEDGFILTLERESDKKAETVDFSYILDSFEQEDAFLAIEQMRFIEESDNYIVTIYVQSLEITPNNYVIKFLLFI